MGRLLGSSSRGEFESFVRSSAPDLLRTANLLTWNLPEAEDLVQEAFLRSAKRWPSIAKMDHPRAYVRRILVNLALADGKRRSRTGMASDPLDDDAVRHQVANTVSPDLLAIDDRFELEWMLADLPRRQRAVLVLRYFEDLSESETASVLGWPVGTVKSTAARALDHLQRRFATSGTSDGESGIMPSICSEGGPDAPRN